MTQQLTADAAEAVLKSISIPPRPAVLATLMKEKMSPDPSLTRLAEVIQSDLSLLAALLKTVNSPLYGLKRSIGSAQQAVQVLGVSNTVSLATSMVLRNTISVPKISLERFWDTATTVALIASAIAQRMPDVSKDEAYTFGMFQDCGIPLMMMRFPDYKDTLRLANAATEKSFTEVEEEHHNTSHVSVGYLLARSWYLPEPLCEAIRNHHDWSIFTSNSNDVDGHVCTLIATTRLAEHISHTFLRMSEDIEWARHGKHVLDYLGLTDTEYHDLRDHVHGMLSS